MRSAYDAGGIRIVEDVLSEPDLQALQTWAERVTYQGVHHMRWRPVWRIGEGEPLRGPMWTVAAPGSAGGPPADRGCPLGLEPLAAVLRRTLLHGPRRYARIILTPWIYPQGTALGLHRDDGRFDGSYIFYGGPPAGGDPGQGPPRGHDRRAARTARMRRPSAGDHPAITAGRRSG
jgi:hypothetical protein